MASVGDKTAEGSVNGFLKNVFRSSAINVLKMFSNIILVFSISKFSLRTLYYSLDTFLELS